MTKVSHIAKKLGLYAGKLSDWRAGRYGPSFTVLATIADVLGLTMDQLLDEIKAEAGASSAVSPESTRDEEVARLHHRLDAFERRLALVERATLRTRRPRKLPKPGRLGAIHR